MICPGFGRMRDSKCERNRPNPADGISLLDSQLTRPGRLSGSSQVVKVSLTPTSSASNLVAKICRPTERKKERQR